MSGLGGAASGTTFRESRNDVGETSTHLSRTHLASHAGWFRFILTHEEKPHTLSSCQAVMMTVARKRCTVFSMSQSQVPSQKMEQHVALTQAQKLAIRQAVFDKRLELVEALTGEVYSPRGECPGCNRRLTTAEIAAGFSDSPTDIQTTCPSTHCRHRFVAKLIHSFRNAMSQIEVSFYCPSQVLEALRNTGVMEPALLLEENASLHRSAVVHYGTLRNAYERAGFGKYPYNERPEWRTVAEPFLGQISDSEIAGCCGVSRNTIRAWRTSLGIDAFSRSALREEVEERLENGESLGVSAEP